MGFFAIDNLKCAASGETECTPRTAYGAFRMQDLGQRSYNPTLGRWVKRDPIGERKDGGRMYFLGKHARIATPVFRQARPSQQNAKPCTRVGRHLPALSC